MKLKNLNKVLKELLFHFNESSRAFSPKKICLVYFENIKIQLTFLKKISSKVFDKFDEEKMKQLQNFFKFQELEDNLMYTFLVNT